jgi:phosphoenolpyruvate carboxykinase (ATP)
MADNHISKIDQDLKNHGINNAQIHYNLSPEKLQSITVEKGLGKETASGVLAINTGKFTGRSPKDRYLVKDDITKDEVWWGEINKPIEPETFDMLYKKINDYLSDKEIYVRDVYACADKNYRVNIRHINELPWSNMFCHNMFLSLTENELTDFQPEWTVINAPGFKANPDIDRVLSPNFAILNFTKKIAIVGGTGYTGEIKKGIFSALNFELPVFKETLPMHCSANVGKEGDTAIFFGLSGTGKTTLSADPERALIGDDEHGWTNENTILNFEGGCYAKAIDLTEEKEPDIYRAIKKGAILENVVLDDNENVDFEDASITQNTRVSYPLSFIDNVQPTSVGHNPKNIFFLTADAFGVLPPISKLTPGQAAFHFISGYTAKVAGTEAGIDEPLPSFSACFGAPFMPLHPTTYAKMLSEKMKEANVNVWLINTGWSGGPYGEGSRIKLKYTRAMITAALEETIDNHDFDQEKYFGLYIPKTCPNVPNEILNPKQTWANPDDYVQKANKLAHSFHENFEKFQDYANKEIMEGAPKVK